MCSDQLNESFLKAEQHSYPVFFVFSHLQVKLEPQRNIIHPTSTFPHSPCTLTKHVCHDHTPHTTSLRSTLCPGSMAPPFLKNFSCSQKIESLNVNADVIILGVSGLYFFSVLKDFPSTSVVLKNKN